MSDPYKRLETTKDRYQCGCFWERRKDKIGSGDVLVECLIHKQATQSSVKSFDLVCKYKAL